MNWRTGQSVSLLVDFLPMMKADSDITKAIHEK